MTRKRTGFFCRFLLRGWWWGLALIGLPVLFLLSLLFTQNDVETDIRNRTLKTLTDNNIDWADTNLDFRGRDVLLTGKAPNQESHDQAVKLLSDVEGVRVVDSEAVIEGAAEATQESQPVQEVATDTHQEAQNVTSANSSQMNTDQAQVNQANQANNDDDALAKQAEAQRQAEEAAKQAEANRKAEEAQQRAQAEAEAKRKAEAAQRRAQAEADAKRKAEEEAARQAKAEANAKRQSCQVRLNDLLAKQNIVFESNVSTIKPQSKTLLKSLSAVILECKTVIPEKGIKISGHTDNLGDSDTNLALSQARADAVKNALAIAGVESRFMEAVGYGETQAIAPNSTAKGRAKNRRISLEINQQ